MSLDYQLPLWTESAPTLEIPASRIRSGVGFGEAFPRPYLNNTIAQNNALLKQQRSVLGQSALRGLGLGTVTAEPWYSVAYSPEIKVFAAVANGGATNRVALSYEGKYWTGYAAQAGAWKAIAWANSLDKFAAVGTTANAMSSVSGDPVNWTLHTAALTNTNWVDLCWSPELSLFVAVASAGTNRVATSSNGTSWTERTAAAANAWRAVCWSGYLGLFVAVSSDGTDRVMTSPDGITWTIRATGSADVFRSVTWSDELRMFSAVGDAGAHYISFDGIDWSGGETTIPGAVNWLKVVWCASIGALVIVSDAADIACAFDYLSDFTWTFQNGLGAATITGATWSNDRGALVLVDTAGTEIQVTR